MSDVPIRKVEIPSFGDVTHVHVVDSVMPGPTADLVRCSVLYSGFSGADMNMRLGHYPLQRKAPLTPGYCFIGRVESCGSKATTFEKGTLVTAMTVYDSEATMINVEEKHLVRVPNELESKMQEVVSLVLDWCTAYGMVYQAAKVKKDQKVFIHGLSGAVGYATMKLCQLRGATVYGTASPRNHDAIIREGGHPYDYKSKAWIAEMTQRGGMHAVFDPLGFESWDESYSILSMNEHSILVGYGGNQASLNHEAEPRSVLWPTIKLYSHNLSFCKRSTTFYYIARDQKTFMPNLHELLDMLRDGIIKVPIKQIWNMEDIQEAHKQYEKGLNGVGSLLIDVQNKDGM